VTDPKAQPPAAAPGDTRLPAMLAAEVFEECLYAVPTIDMRDIGARLLAPFVRAAGARRGSLMLVNPASGKLRVVAGLGIDQDLIGRDIEWRPSSISEWVFRKRQGLVLNGDVKQEGLQGTSGGAIESAICVPLQNDDSVIGVVNLSCDASMPPFTEADMVAVHGHAAAGDRRDRARAARQPVEPAHAPAGGRERTDRTHAAQVRQLRGAQLRDRLRAHLELRTRAARCANACRWPTAATC
jgi:hypothetical protein